MTDASDRTDPTAGATTEACRITILHDDAVAKSRAERVCHHLAWTLQGRTSLEFSVWRFDQLTHPVASQKAAIAVANADVVIISVTKSYLPAEVRAWLAYWNGPRANPDGVLALLASGPVEWNIFDNELAGFLAAFAQRHGLDFLPGGAAGTCTVMNRLDLRAEVVTPVLHGILDRSPHGG